MLAVAEPAAKLSGGRAVVRARLPLTGTTETLLYTRLRYVIAFTEGPPQEDILDLAAITPDLVELRVAAPQVAVSGSQLVIRVRTAHPVSNAALAGVHVSAELTLNAGPITATATTGVGGHATLALRLPATTPEDTATLRVRATHRGWSREAEQEIDLKRQLRYIVNTDKPLYQPGQVLHYRAVVLDGERRAIRDLRLVLTIRDDDNTLLHRAELTTSAYGVVSADWKVPENTALGDYSLHLEPDDTGGHGQAHQVRVSRYDLPNFFVVVKPDRAYYLPGQDAQVEVRAEQVFGKPLPRGHVRVVREGDRTWDPFRRAWEVEETAAFEGDTGPDGRFVARIPLAEDHAELNGDRYQQHRDLRHVAYFTDPSTGRTEHRRFDLRVAVGAIQVYALAPWGRGGTDELPQDVYITASFADGGPAAGVRLQIHAGDDSGTPGLLLATLRANSYGVAKARRLRFPGSGYGNWITVVATAPDGRTSRVPCYLRAYGEGNGTVALDVPRSIYRPGEPLQVELRSVERSGTVMLDLLRDGEVLRSTALSLRNGRATVLMPYQPRYRGVLTIMAYSLTRAESRYAYPQASRSVVYPFKGSLDIGLRLDKRQYRPGEQASAALRVHSPEGAGVRAVIGAVAFDRAVEERARAEGDIGVFGFRLPDSGASEVAGYSRSRLEVLESDATIPPDLDLLAEVVLNSDYSGSEVSLFGWEDRGYSLLETFAPVLRGRLAPVTKVLEQAWQERSEYPRSVGDLRRLLAAAGIGFDGLRDPWGSPLLAGFDVRAFHTTVISSAGPDKRPDTADDFPILTFHREYFRPVGAVLERVLSEYQRRTGEVLKDSDSIREELVRAGVPAGLLSDPWGHPYRFEFSTAERVFALNVRSAGPDGRFVPTPESDDILVWTRPFDYFAVASGVVNAALREELARSGALPEEPSRVRSLLLQSGVPGGMLRDPWDSELHIRVLKSAVPPGDASLRFTVPESGRRLPPAIPGQQVLQIVLFSGGPDRLPGTRDDFRLAVFQYLVLSPELPPRTPKPADSAKGAIVGVVCDLTGAVVPSARVVASHIVGKAEFEVLTDEEGRFYLLDLPPGSYSVFANLPGFKTGGFASVPVRAGLATEVSITLETGAVTETVEVSAAPVTVDTTSTAVGTSVQSLPNVRPLATPRLREYFPETLLWEPALETDVRGRATLRFPMADNITTWKLSVIATTQDGKVGVADREMSSFQPFFVEHDPPKVLTEGDRISLRLPLRNYLPQAQQVAVEITPQPWYEIVGPPRVEAMVQPDDVTVASLSFRALRPVDGAPQRVTARSHDVADAVERPVSVRPNGQEVLLSSMRLFSDSTRLEFSLPEEALAHGRHAELRIYPDVASHLSGALEAMLQRPTGCAEQTISSTYPSVMLLRYVRARQMPESATTRRALRYAEVGYQRLLNYRAPGGGFSYWGGSSADLALTAYALRFLHDAESVIPVDDELVQETRQWLLQQQAADGNWKADAAYSPQVSAYVAWVLAATAASGDGKAGAAEDAKLLRALDFLKRAVEAKPDPYALAGFVLAAHAAGKSGMAGEAVLRLRDMEQRTRDGSYWDSSRTPFHGWGLSGRLENTALVVQALAAGTSGAAILNDGPAARGFVFLLSNKDAYGGWLSTQATVSVLDALLLLPDSAGGAYSLEITVNGQRLTTAEIPAGGGARPATIVDLSSAMAAGNNVVELRGSGARLASAQISGRFFLPWDSPQRPRPSAVVGLAVSYDRTSLSQGELVRANIAVERSAGTGMLLAEIGLPPGADVDRESLGRARDADDGLYRYDVLPDRVVLYLWPRESARSFEFSFRPLLAVDALTAPSLLFDYYNPGERAVVPPTRFRVTH